MATKRAFLTTSFAASLALATAGAAGAQQNPDYTAPAPVVSVTAPPVQNLSTPVQRSTSSAPLALTGTDALQLVVAGGVLVAGGAGVLVARRRASA